MKNSASLSAVDHTAPRWRRLIGLMGLALLYFLAARAGLMLASIHGSASPVWPATGIAIAALVLGGLRYWPSILAGAFAANAMTEVPLWAAGLIAAGNTLEALAGAWCVRTVRQRFERAPFAEPAAVCVAAVAGPSISASWGVTVLWLAGTLPAQACATVGLTWFVGDALGALVVVPVVLVAARALSRAKTWKRSETALAAGLVLAGLVIAGIVFLRPGGTAYLFLVFPWLFAVAAAFRAIGAYVGAFALAVVSVLGTAGGLGPFSGTSLNENLLNLQLFLAAITVTAMVLPAFRPRAGWWLPAVVLLVGWALSGWLFTTLEEDRREVDRKRIIALIEHAERDVMQRMRTYEDAMRGGVSLFATDQDVDADRWRAYVETLELFERYPGVYGMGVIFPVPRGREAEFVAYQQEMLVPEFKIHPVPGGAHPVEMKERFVITYIEPLQRNLKARGLEISSERRRCEGAVVSRDEGRAVISDSVPLVQDGASRPGFMFFMPMYRSGQPKETVAQRQAAFVGWIYAPFVTEFFFKSALAGHLGELSVRIYDAPEATREHLVFTGGSMRGGDAAGAGDVARRGDFGGRTYTYVWSRGADFLSNHNSASAWAAACAAIVSLLMAGLVLTLQTVGHRANAIAGERTTALATNEARMRAILETALDAVVMLNDRGEVIEWNPQAERIFGWTRAEALGKRLLELMLPERFGRVRSMGFQRFLEGRAERVLDRRVEVTARDRHGREFPCELAMVTIRGNGSVWLSLFLRDISGRKQAEQALLAAKEAAEAGTRAKSDFLATMSHEIRTPMNGVIGFARLLLDTPLTEQQQEFARIIQTSGDNLLELINGILDLSRIEAGKLEVEKVRFNFEEILKPVVQLLSPRAEEKSLQLAFDYPKDVPRWLLGDSSRVRQILINLAGNALKFTERGSVRIMVSREGTRARVEVQDTGPGIPGEKQAMLFQKFSQGDSSTTRRFGGSGLGLAIAKNLVELMDGAIGVRSIEGQGSVFWFTLPVAPATSDAPVEQRVATDMQRKLDTLAPIPGTVASKLRVLLAEDNVINQMLVRAFLESMGCVVDIVETGTQAVAKTEQAAYDGVLMDCHMPELDGFLATQAIRAREQKNGATRRLGIVALTASAMEEDRQRCLAAGMDGHLIKPLNPEKLREVLEMWMKRRVEKG